MKYIAHITTICLSSVTLLAAPQLRLSSSTLGPIYVESGANAQPQVINAFNIGDGALNLAVTSSTASWLSGSVGQPSTCSGGLESVCIPVTLTLNTAGLAIGNYSESLTLHDPNAIDSPQIVTVQLQVNGSPASADLYVTPNNGASTAQSDTASLTVNTGSAVLSTVTTSDNGSWLNFTLGANHVVYSSYQLLGNCSAWDKDPRELYGDGHLVGLQQQPNRQNNQCGLAYHVPADPPDSFDADYF